MLDFDNIADALCDRCGLASAAWCMRCTRKRTNKEQEALASTTRSADDGRRTDRLGAAEEHGCRQAACGLKKSTPDRAVDEKRQDKISPYSPPPGDESAGMETVSCAWAKARCRCSRTGTVSACQWDTGPATAQRRAEDYDAQPGLLVA